MDAEPRISPESGAREHSALGVGPVGERLEGVRSIAVLRGGGLGDLMFALPAIEALSAAYPDARITLLGEASFAALLANRPSPVDEVLVLPAAEGVRKGVTESDPEEVDAFVAAMRERRFDLAVQLHGGGRFSNPFVASLGARTTIGLRTPDAQDLDRTLAYVYYQHEVMRALEVVGLVGARPAVLAPRLAVTDEDRARAARLIGGEPAGPVVAMHPGATDPRRRWPTERFGDVAARAVAAGGTALIVGDSGDAELADGVVADAVSRGADPARVLSLAGKCDLGELLGVLASADVFVGNDSGPRHLAGAVGCPTVSVYWIGNVVNAGPLERTRHRVHMSWTTRCPVCGVDVTQVGWTAERCEHDPSFVAEVGVDPVWADALELTARSPRARA